MLWLNSQVDSWLLEGEKAWAQPQPQKELHSYLGCSGLTILH